MSSCTSGLILTLQALAPRGAVVIPSFTFSASAHAVAWNGLRPVFAECDLFSAQIDTGDARRRLDGASAILATHVFGAPCQAEQIESLGREAGLSVVFDAAHAFGAVRGGRRVGSFGDAEVFSMTPTKLVVAGEGGLVATNSGDLAHQIRLGRDYGNPGDYNTRFVGLSARLSELHAAMAIESLAILPEHLERRREVAARYREGVAEIPGVEAQVVEAGDESTYKDFTVRIDQDIYGVQRDVVVEALLAEGIGTRCYFSPPVHLQDSYAHLGPVSLPVTERLAGEVISLPIYPSMSTEDIDQVVLALAEIHNSAPLLQTELERR